MSPRRTRAATVEQAAVFTRSRAQKVNNTSQNVDKSAQKVRHSHRKEKPARNNLEAASKQSAKKESPDAEVALKKSARKKTSRRRLNLDETAGSEDANRTVGSNESIRILRNRHCDNVTVELGERSTLQPSVPRDLNSEIVPNGKLPRKTSTKASPVIVTPKSTPPKLSLTPHRSKKTPKKSPVFLGSPKTHSMTKSKLFKSPRKLSLAGENSKENLGETDGEPRARKSRRSKKNSLSGSPVSNKSASMSPTGKDKRKKSVVNLRTIVRRFSKSPKIILKTPKSKKSKSAKLNLSPSPMKRGSSASLASPSPNRSKSDSRIRIKKSQLSKGMYLSSNRHRLIRSVLLNSKLAEVLTASQTKDVLAEPIVLVEKLSLENLKRKNVLMAAGKTRSGSPVKVRSPSIRAGNNSKILISMREISAGSSTKRNSNSRSRNSSMERSRGSNTNRISPRIKYNASAQENNRLSTPLMSSTPQAAKMMTSKDTSWSDTSVGSVNNTSLTSLRHRGQSSLHLSNTMDKSTNIENISKSSLSDKEMNDTSRSHLLNVTKRSATYDKDNTMEKNRDDTYELEQPQTLNLRQMAKKRASVDMDLSLKDTVKKAKVHFANITPRGGSVRRSINKLNGSNTSRDVGTQNRGSILNSVLKSKKIETPKRTRNALISSFKRSSPRFHGGTPRAQLNRTQVTPKTFVLSEKKSEKKSSTKKVPNFGKIHEQMFAKSESLVDAKKRLEARHQAFANKARADMKTEGKKPLPSETRDGIHNRFGFKLKKPDVTQIVLKKQAVFPKEKQQSARRMTLKGVRTNRRFELQMKARNLNL
ncbi:PREDICTED: probable serine/threonine-protein kinase nek3 [Vollenhovia emeryi]|uniref:probable serine/threonine-protein kinase nek3 n=1 Tax=Vollenhovia emeryi TaxID=411798 RepID=UPI0005F4269C|nr:PREDICTED: probable serine/threonine-protein kinase nek3 [Vollenhovia emeryi]